MAEQFCKLTHEIMRATHWISKTTGERFKLTGDQKVIWTQMTSRYEFFHSQGRGWFDNQEDIAFATGCSVSAVKRFIKLLTEHGYMQVERRKLRGFVHSNSYKIVAPLQVCSSNASANSLEALSSDDISLDVAPAVFPSSEAVNAVQEATEQLVPVFEDIPLDAYIDTPSQEPVIVHERLLGFTDMLDAKIQFEVPVLPKGLSDTVNEPDIWG